MAKLMTFALLFFGLFLCSSLHLRAQTTAFTYQGSLRDGTSLANGNYDFEFRLYDAVTAGAQQGVVQQRSNVAVVVGVFTVSLDFGAGAFKGANRYLEISVRLAGQPTFTILGPRQLVTSSPYSVKSLNTDNDLNVFVGSGAGGANTTGGDNTFLGATAGNANTTGDENTYVGRLAGNNSNAAGARNTLLGYLANFGVGTINNATAIGNRAQVTQSNSLVLGGINGINGATQDTNVGIGITAPTGRLHVVGNSVLTGDVSLANTNAGQVVTIGAAEVTQNSHKVGIFSTTAFNVVLRDNSADIEGFLGINANGLILGSATNHPFQIRTNGTNRINIEATGEVGIGVVNPSSTLDVNGTIEVATLGVAGATALCRNASNQISTCSSSMRYKTNVGGFSKGFSFVDKLRPITFNWKDGGMEDVGFGAEDVAKIDPRFVTFNDKGEVEGVKYDRFSVVFVNALNEQQTQMEKQQLLIEKQQALIEQLEKRLEQLERK
ncbi:MAG: tail fiber domain-containing protein [Chloracidobacterium sp.]|nr:tail fiber domain-containing protein [Chloracidobacterium sp.]